MNGEHVDIGEYFKIRENCITSCKEVRDLYNTRTTEEQAKQAYKTLNIMRLYCPEDVEVIVDATIAEFEFRMAYFNFDLMYGEGVADEG